MADRLAGVLTARLEELACGAPSAPVHRRRPVARLLEAASVATMRAVALELLTDDAARGSGRAVEDAAPGRRASSAKRPRAFSSGRSPRRSCGRACPRAASRRGARAAPSAARRAARAAPPTRARARRCRQGRPARTGPIGQPAPFVSAVSRSSGETLASSRTRTQSFSSGIRIRFTMKPGVSLQLTGRFPACSAQWYARRTASSLEPRARTISTSGSTGAGLKKCMPTTRSGCSRRPPRSP